ncbi:MULTISPECIES: TorD/DmsD family molecular chaperone [Halomonadaceae]|jgi:TorA maturation chaperone TorD|uniref:Molecular chaperone TorD family protein n=1 Tax=Vreelandella janggokensis TaxID=370767 RepID=A0ABT4IU00_9GAMM|nr:MULTISPECIES: molecular chaperone TorD family protein [Halomonas]MCW4150503.1 molecular chaperone TorD family protein [Halomonas sp. 18H]MCZ0927123.1 molecular chaperone TorD family protein [Halomonas janggokensis]MCZ0929631.1 molecular chaperone TorD family protein [Halomonas janggokensis]MDR5886167.1 molecular chaperone TorD family protein [Halomonas janggokensis]QPL45719.1 molecular chaperone TorD family protein [Halomonas sp. A40-4]
MTQAAPTLSEADALRADIYRLIAALLREAPTEELLGWLASLDIEQDGSRLAECWHGLSQAANSVDAASLKRAHFGHLVGVIQGDVVPYASWYRNGELMEAALVALRRDLGALGFERSEHTKDPEDHLAALCEVMAMLIDATSPDQAHFFMHHLAPWASDCFDDLGQVDTAFYAALGQLGSAFMTSEEDRLAIEASHAPVNIVEP